MKEPDRASAHRFLNGNDQPLRVWIEPWCDEFEVPPGSILVIRQEGLPDGEDETMIEPREELLIFWCGGSGYEAELDGEPALPRSDP